MTIPTPVALTDLEPDRVYYAGSTSFDPHFTAVRVRRVNRKDRTLSVDFLGAVDREGKPTDDDVQSWTNWRPPDAVLLYASLDDAACALAIEIEKEVKYLRDEAEHIESRLPKLTAWLRGD